MSSSLEGKKEEKRSARERKERTKSYENRMLSLGSPGNRFHLSADIQRNCLTCWPGLEGQTFCIVPKDRTGKVEGGKREVGDRYKEGLSKRGPEAELPIPKLKQDFSVMSYGKVLLQ